MTEDNKPPLPCPEWCADANNHAHPDLQIHDSKPVCPPDPSSLVAYAQQADYRGVREPAVIQVSVVDPGMKHEDGTTKRARLELPADQARALSLIINDAAKAGIKEVRALGRGIGELAALIEEPEADELEAGA